ncbi:rhodanese-like domain-containing protein [Atopococcus tabaci]|uniref:rhodanese-like domain-containing protein n=1 Tax=Atopococcus tabaci TaxID=269774 RepID=UPI002409AE01|nr:rhodanese-like domain-containing protein [Atopococcus tabaci]
MNKLNYSEIKDQQLVDSRLQHAFQAGHLKGSLNLNPSNFEKYAAVYLDADQPVVFVISREQQAELDEMATLAEELGFTQIDGFVLADELPQENLETTATIPAAAFLEKEDDYILLDVRHPDEITRPAPEKNLVNIPFEDLLHDHASLDSSKDIYTLCGSGNRSTAAASYLATKGFKPTVIEGGIKAVQEASH